MGMLQIRVYGNHIKIGKTLPSRVREKLSPAIEKHFNRAASANVTFKKEKENVRTDCTVHLSSGITMKARGAG